MVQASVAGDGVVPSIRVDVLGPLRLWVGGAVVDVPGPKRRALLALLAMGGGRAVTVLDLYEALWREALPETAKGTLHSHVSRLRRHLGPAAERLEAVGAAYRLRPGPDGVTDVEGVRALLEQARGVTPQAAFGLLRTARALWRGPPLAEFDEVEPLRAWGVALLELRQQVELAHVTAAVDAGATGEAVELAEALVAADPYGEPPTVLLMRALYRAGRGADALRAAYVHRRRLATETGLEPSAALGTLERDIAGASTVRPGAVPRPGGRLHGRDAELAALHRLLGQERLVTVLGPGGVGKTRLATEAAARQDEVTAVLLAAVTDPVALPHVLAEALGLVVRGDVLSACEALLGAGPRLLLLDGCEHLLAGTRDLIARLLGSCPELRVLATSREPFGLPVEQQLRIGPLRLSGTGDHKTSPAVTLFLDRARRIRPTFVAGPSELALVADLVRRVDGLPLAIELGAGRLSSMDLADLHTRLDRALDLLGGGGLATLRQTIAWSYDLLPEDERRLFCHLAAFPDGFALATAESVAGMIGLAVDPGTVLAHLVDTSMVDLELGETPRYRMLDSMRTFGLAQPAEHGGGSSAAASLRRWALELVAWIDEVVYTEDTGSADAVLRREIGNLRAVWAAVRAEARLDEAVSLVVELGEAMGWRDLTELWDWALELAEDPALAGHLRAAAVLGTAATCAWDRGSLDHAQDLALRGLDRGGDGVWICRSALGLIALSRGDIDDAVRHAIWVAEHAPRPDQSLGAAALAVAYGGDLAAARALNERFGKIAVAPTHSGFQRYVSAEIDALSARYDTAGASYAEAIRLARSTGATFLEGLASVGRLSLLVTAGRIGDALTGYGELIDYWERTGAWIQQWTTLRNLAALLRTLDDARTADAIDASADAAPDAPAVIGSDDRAPRASCRPLTRGAVLELARDAVRRHRVTLDNV